MAGRPSQRPWCPGRERNRKGMAINRIHGVVGRPLAAQPMPSTLTRLPITLALLPCRVTPMVSILKQEALAHLESLKDSPKASAAGARCLASLLLLLPLLELLPSPLAVWVQGCPVR